MLQFPGMRRTGAPSGTRTGRVGRFAYRPTTKPQWGFVSPRESPRWCTTNALQKTARRFFATFKEGGRFCAFFLGIRDIGMMAGSARPLQINRKRHFGGDFRRSGGIPPYVLKGSLWGMSDIYRAKGGQRASGMSIKFQKFRDSSAKNSK